jgi:hypothetical protein
MLYHTTTREKLTMADLVVALTITEAVSTGTWDFVPGL